MKIKVLSPGEMRAARLKSAQDSIGMSQEEAHAQMRRNGSIPTLNPWYTGKKEGGSLRLLPKKK